MRYVMLMAKRFAELKRRARAANIPVFYVNDMASGRAASTS